MEHEQKGNDGRKRVERLVKSGGRNSGYRIESREDGRNNVNRKEEGKGIKS